jgi:hypothetical protein
MQRASFLGAALLSAAVIASCSNSSTPAGGDAGGCPAYVVPSGTDLTTPAISFKNDIIPFFVLSCDFSACHADGMMGSNGLALGNKMMTTNVATVYGAIVGKPSGQLPTMNYITANDPSKSYMMHKLDGDQCLYEGKCTGSTSAPSCMGSMPLGSPLLDVPTRDKLRKWIAQGAQNN